MTLAFAVTWDYRCPFARNAHEHLLTGLGAGADWDVTFLPFSLGQAHVEEGATSVWDDPARDSGILALQAGVVVRDTDPDAFPAVHRALFAARHDESLKIKEAAVVRDVLAAQGVEAEAVFAAIDDGSALKTVQAEHEAYAASHAVWGVPTFITGDEAVFVRFMHRSPDGSDPGESIRSIERVVELLDWPDLNEYKHTSIPR
ncbi:MAG: DsbA family protein [Acidimicrobiales bacterium]